MEDKVEVMDGSVEVPMKEILAELGEKVIEVRILKTTIRGMVAELSQLKELKGKPV